MSEVPLAAWLPGLLQAGDSYYPTGSYAHSFGLEGLVDAGVVHDRDTLRDFLLTTALPSLAHADLPVVALAWSAFRATDWPAIGELSQLSSALRSSREARQASQNIGRQRSELLATLHPNSLAGEYLLHASAGRWPFSAPIAAALESRVHGAPLEAALVAYLYSTAASLLAAAMKLVRLGQNGAQELLAEILAQAPALVAEAKNTPKDAIGWFNPWLDIAAARHETADARMFIS